MSTPAPSIFPLIRLISRPVTAVLARFPVTPNLITAAALMFGLGAAWAAAEATRGGAIAAGLLLSVAYVLDNCDGEIARLKNQCSRFGMYFDSFVDWVVHTVFFWALGAGAAAATGDAFWNWLGLAAAAGGTLNYVLGFVLAAREEAKASAAENADRPRTPGEWLLFAFRELARADFCFIVLALGLLDALWVLLPAGAVGAQVYWLTSLAKRAREFHV